jgi:hypothetical protein
VPFHQRPVRNVSPKKAKAPLKATKSSKKRGEAKG